MPPSTLFARLRAGPPLPKIDIAYPSGGLRITGLMVAPPGDGPFPVLVLNHGGFEPASSVGGLAHMFAKLGYFTVASDYRGSGGSQGHHEMAAGEVDDVLALIDWTANQPAADPDRIVMMGLSHGGAIAVLAAARQPNVRAIVNLAGPADMAAWWAYVEANADRLPNCRRLVEVIGAVPGLRQFGPDEWARRSPLAVADRVGCPVLIIHGAADDMVPVEQSHRLAVALRAAGNPAKLIVDPLAGHYFDAAAWDRVGRRLIDFLNTAVGLPPLAVDR